MGVEFDTRRIEVIDDATAAMYRRMTPGQRVRLGLGQFEFATRAMAAGIRYCHPQWTDSEVRAEVLRRLIRAAG